MSSYLWRYYLEDDADRFQRLLQSSRSGAHGSGFSGGGNPHHRKSNMTSSSGRPGSPPDVTVLTKQQVRSTDSMGRSVLHLACSEEKKLPYVTALLNNPLVDPAQADAESGWNALHRALYHGNISVAREILAVNPANWGLVKAKDHAGDAPFDVYGAIISDLEDTMIEDRKPDKAVDSDDESEVGHDDAEEEVDLSRGEEVFTWGSNKNLTLGFADGDDRQYPERVSFKRPNELLVEEARRRYGGASENKGKSAEDLVDAAIMFSPLKIRDVRLSKFHSAILTDDPHSNLFICGFGNGGRLGFGDDQNTQFTYRALKPPLLPKRRVASIALGMDHTVGVMEDSEVYTWGSNKYGQLGYGVQTRTPQDEPVQTTPRLVQGLLKREDIIGCAASRIHTVVYTSDSLYTWGKNDGQLGILASSEDRNLATQSSPRKVSANCLTNVTIIRAVAVDTATAVLLHGGEVWIFAGHGYSKLLFPIERFVGLPDGAKNITRYDHGLNIIQRIASGGDTICAISSGGDVFAVDVASTLKERAEKSGSGRVPWICQHAWSMRKRHMAVRDVDVGTDGNIIIATRDGSVYQRTKRIRPKEGGGEGSRYKFSRVPGLTRITTVRSNTTGVFAAIRKDTDVMEKALRVDPQGLWDEFPEMYWADLIQDQLEGEWFEGGFKPTVKEYEIVLKGISEDLVREFINMFAYDSDVNSAYDASISTVTAKDLRIPIHSVALARSPVLRKLLASNGGQIGTAAGEVTFIDSGKPHAVFNDVQLFTILNLYLYLYTDYVLDPWECANVSRAQHTRYEALRLELLGLANELGLDVLSDSLQRRVRISKSLDRDMRRAYNDPDFFTTADMILDLLDGESMAVHSSVMRSRCPFFSALYGDGDLGGGSGRWLEGRLDGGRGEPLHIDLTHIAKETMDLVVSWLYHDWGLEEFDGIRAGVKEEDVDTFLDFVLDVLSAANELMLDRLGQICQKIMGRYVNTRNAAGLLSAVADAAQKGFKEAALLYVCLNMETMLENHLLDELDEDLMFDIDAVIHRYNARSTQSGVDNQFARLLATHPDLPDLVEREKKKLIESHIAEAEEQALALAFRQSHGNVFFYGSSPGGSGNTPGSARKKGKQPVTTPRKISAKQPAEKENDEIFSMDSSDENGSDGDGNHPVNTPIKQRRVWAALPSPARTPDTQSPQSSFVGAPGSFSTPPRKPSGLGTNGVPWSTPPPVAQKLDMREIMAQASSSDPSTSAEPGKSALTAGLSLPSPAAALAASPPTAPSPAVSSIPITLPAGGSFKKSQKERKKQQQKQPLPGVAAAPSSTPIKPKPVWKVPVTAGEVLHLKDVLAPHTETDLAPAPPPPPQRPVVIKIPSTSTVLISTPPTTHTPITPAPPRPPRSQKLKSPPSPARPSPQPQPQSQGQKSSHHFHGIKLTLQEVMEQETAQKEAAKEYAAKRSLQEIQEEQEFMRWWERESRRAQGLPDLEEVKKGEGEGEGEKRDSEKAGAGRGGKKGRGRGGKKAAGGGGGDRVEAGRAPPPSQGAGPARGSALGARAGRGRGGRVQK